MGWSHGICHHFEAHCNVYFVVVSIWWQISFSSNLWSLHEFMLVHIVSVRNRVYVILKLLLLLSVVREQLISFGFLLIIKTYKVINFKYCRETDLCSLYTKRKKEKALTKRIYPFPFPTELVFLYLCHVQGHNSQVRRSLTSLSVHLWRPTWRNMWKNRKANSHTRNGKGGHWPPPPPPPMVCHVGRDKRTDYWGALSPRCFVKLALVTRCLISITAEQSQSR